MGKSEFVLRIFPSARLGLMGEKKPDFAVLFIFMLLKVTKADIMCFGDRHRASSVIRAESVSLSKSSCPAELALWLSALPKSTGEVGSQREENALANKSLYVGNLSYSTTEEELKSLFDPWGPVAEVRIIQGRGFGFVDVPEEKAAEAIEQTNGKEYQGRTLTVNEARPRAESRGGGRGGYGGGRRERW